MEFYQGIIDNHYDDYQRLLSIMQTFVSSIKNDYVVWFQHRLKTASSLMEKNETRQKKNIDDVIGFRIIYPWMKGLEEIANLLESHPDLNISERRIFENGKVIYLYGHTSIGTTYEIQLWPTIIYTCFEYEHDKIYKPNSILTDLQLKNSQKVRINEHVLQSFIDEMPLVPY